jgi:hypothetical protein
LVKEISPSEASDVIMSLIDEKLIFIKTKAQNWEQNHKSNSDEIDERISSKRKASCQRFYY